MVLIYNIDKKGWSKIMKTIRRALLMLKRNRKETISFMMTLTCSFGLLHLFVNLQSASNQNAWNLQDTNDMIMVVFTCIIACMCAMNAFFANSYFQKAKSKELCVYLTCGMNIIALAKYLFVQNMIIFLISTILGGLLGVLLNPVMNLIIMILLDVSMPIFNITTSGTLIWLFLLLYVFIFMIMSNVGYAYRNELKDLLNESHRIAIDDTRFIKTPGICYTIAYVFGLIFIFFVPRVSELFVLGCVFGICGLQGMIRYILPEKLEAMKHAHVQLNAKRIMVAGELYSTLKSTGMYMIMLFGILIFMCCFIYNFTSSPYLLCILSIGFLLLLLMMGLSIYYKMITIAKKQRIDYDHLQLMGFLKKGLKEIIIKQMQWIFLLLLILPLPYALLITMKFIMNAGANTWLGLFLLGSYSGILILIYLLTKNAYCTIILAPEGEHEHGKNN